MLKDNIPKDYLKFLFMSSSDMSNNYELLNY